MKENLIVILSGVDNASGEPCFDTRSVERCVHVYTFQVHDGQRLYLRGTADRTTSPKDVRQHNGGSVGYGQPAVDSVQDIGRTADGDCSAYVVEFRVTGNRDIAENCILRDTVGKECRIRQRLLTKVTVVRLVQLVLEQYVGVGVLAVL